MPGSQARIFVSDFEWQFVHSWQANGSGVGFVITFTSVTRPSLADGVCVTLAIGSSAPSLIRSPITTSCGVSLSSSDATGLASSSSQ